MSVARARTAAVAIVAAFLLSGASPAPPAPRPIRLYVMDCGTIHVSDPGRFQLKKEQVAALDFAVGCFLIVHPKGTLMWDVGAVPDAAWKPTGSPVMYHITLPDSQFRDVTMRVTLRAQLAKIGVKPSNVTYLALSHDHYDHTANANDFASAIWLVRAEERDAMFATPPPPFAQPSTYAALKQSKTHIIQGDDYDVFGDGTVVIKFAPGHTPGHQVLFVKLAQTGPVLLAGDLYHYPEQVALQTIPLFDYDSTQTRASRIAIAAFVKATGAQMWIQHDLLGNARLRKSPEFYQ